MNKKRLLSVFLSLAIVFTLGFVIQGEANEIEIPLAHAPILVTSAGQSPDDHMVRILSTRLGVEVKHSPLIKVEDIEGIKTFLFAIGGSAKGLGEAGIDIFDEVERIGAILDRIEELKEEYPGEILSVGIHIGGEGRRGELSQRSIDATASRVDLLIVWQEGDLDGMFTDLAKENEIPLIIIDAVRDVQDILAKMYAQILEE